MVAVLGAALTTFNRRKDGSSFRDWAAEATDAAIAMAGLERAEIEMLVVASESDFFTLQLNPASVLANDLGLSGAAAFRVEGGGASGQLAVHAGVQAILSGTAARVLVVGVDPSASQLPAAAMKELYSYSFDFWHEGATGVSATALYALSVQGAMERLGLTDDDLAAVTIGNRDNARLNPNAHLPRQHTAEEIAASPMIASPYRRLHCSPLSDGAAALVLAAEASVPAARRSAARIRGIGAATDRVHLGARTAPDHFAAKTTAMGRACTMADVTPEQLEAAEVYDAYAGAQIQALEALGLSSDIVVDLRGDAFGRGGRCPVNLSGGLMGQGAPVGAIGVAQTATCALLVEGRYHDGLQPATPPALALADTHGGVCTTAAVTIVGQGAAA